MRKNISKFIPLIFTTAFAPTLSFCTSCSVAGKTVQWETAYGDKFVGFKQTYSKHPNSSVEESKITDYVFGLLSQNPNILAQDIMGAITGTKDGKYTEGVRSHWFSVTIDSIVKRDKGYYLSWTIEEKYYADYEYFLGKHIVEQYSLKRKYNNFLTKLTIPWDDTMKWDISILCGQTLLREDKDWSIQVEFYKEKYLNGDKQDLSEEIKQKNKTINYKNCADASPYTVAFYQIPYFSQLRCAFPTIQIEFDTQYDQWAQPPMLIQQHQLLPIDKVPTPPVPRQGYKFNGWAFTKDGKGTMVNWERERFHVSTKLYGIWEKE